MNLPRRKSAFLHRRILIVFLFSIALPGAYIGYIGLRSVVQEQELQRAILVQSLQRTLEFEIDKLEQTLKDAEESSARALVASKSPPTLIALANFEASRAWVEDVFVFDSHLSLRGPIPFASRPILVRKPLISEQFVRVKADEAAQLELQGDHNAAVSSYQQLLHEDLSLQSRVVLNTYLARAAAATGNQVVARRAYDTIVRTDSTFRITQPIPFAAFAWIEIVEDLARQGSVDEALRISVKLYQHLLDFYSQFSSDQHSYFLQKVHSQLGSLKIAANLTTDIERNLRNLEEEERLVARALSRAARIKSWLQTKQAAVYAEDSVGGVHHRCLIADGESLPLSLTFVNGLDGGRRCIAFVIRPAEIEREFLVPGLQVGSWAKDFTVTVRTDSVSIANRQELVSSKMHETAVWYPSLEIVVSSKTASTSDILGIPPPLLFSIGLASLVLVVIMLGIFIIYRDIRREEELSKMKSEFISNVSHELKTPIAAIRMLADNLRESRVESDGRRIEYYQLISKEGARLSHLIENILDFSRIEERRKAFRPEKCDVNSIVSETVRQFKSLVEDRAQRISVEAVEASPEVLVVPDALALAVFNLLDNAVKYSERDTAITVRVHRRNGVVCIEVEDHGLGIPKTDQKRIFEKFYRVHENEGKKVSGSGIGLTLVKEIAEAHHGRVEVRSQPGVGSTFQILLPIGE